MLENFQGDSWGSIPPLRMPSLLPHDLCHGRSASRWLPAVIEFQLSYYRSSLNMQYAGSRQLPTPVFWPGEFHGLYSSWGPKSQTRLSNFQFQHKTEGRYSSCHTCLPTITVLSWNIFVVVQSLSRVQLFATPWTAARQASLSLTVSWSSPKFMSIKSVMPSNHLILCCPLLLLPSIFPSIRVFSNKSALHIRWPKYWSFSISPSNEYSGLITLRIDWFDLHAAQWTRKSFLQITIQKL